MKNLVAALFVFMLALSGVATWMRPSPPHDGKVHLTWMSDSNPTRSEQLQVFNRLHPEVDVRLDPPDANNSIQKIAVQATSGVGPDMFDIYNGVSDMQACMEIGILWDLTRVGKERGFSMDDALWPRVRSSVSYRGAQYTYPANVNIDVLIYNKSIFDQQGVPYPADDLTWEAFLALAARIPHSDEDINSPFAVVRLGWKHYFNSLEGEYFSEDGTQLHLQSDAMRRALQMHHDAIFKYHVTPRALDLKTLSAQGGWGVGEMSYFADGKFAMIAIGKWSLIAFRQAYRDQQDKLRRWEANPDRDPATKPQPLRIGAVMLPHDANHAPAYLVDTRAVGVNTYSPHRPETLQFLSYLASPEYSRTVNHGVDGLPPNPRYAREGLEPGVPDLSEGELHQRSMDAMAYGRAPRLSPFLLTNDVERVLNDQINRMEVSPELPVDALLTEAQRELETLLQRNLERDPALRQEFEKRRAESAPTSSRVAEITPR